MVLSTYDTRKIRVNLHDSKVYIEVEFDSRNEVTGVVFCSYSGTVAYRNGDLEVLRLVMDNLRYPSLIAKEVSEHEAKFVASVHAEDAS